MPFGQPEGGDPSLSEPIVISSENAVVACHTRLLDRDQVSYDWQHYIPLIEKKPGALRNGAPFTELPAPLSLIHI